MDKYKKIYRVLYRVSQVLAWIGIAAVIIITIMTTIDVILKLISRASSANMFINGMYEFTQMFMILMVFLAYALAEFSDTHVSVQIITTKLKPQARRILNLIVRIIMVVFMVILTYSCILQNQAHISGNLQTSVLFMSYTPFTIAMTVGTIMFTIAMICRTINCFISVIKNDEEWEKDLLPKEKEVQEEVQENAGEA